METNPEIIKNKIHQLKTELEQKFLNYKSENSKTEIQLLYSCFFKKISYKGKALDDDLINEINQAIIQAKTKFGEDYKTELNKIGIRL